MRNDRLGVPHATVHLHIRTVHTALHQKLAASGNKPARGTCHSQRVEERRDDRTHIAGVLLCISITIECRIYLILEHRIYPRGAADTGANV